MPLRWLIFLLCLLSCSAAAPQIESLPVPRSQGVPAASPPARPVPSACQGSDPASGRGGPQRVFQVSAPERSSGLAFTPSGEVVVFSSSWLDVLDPVSGQRLDGKRFCWGLKAFGFVAEHRAVAICSEEILEITYPGLAHRQLLKSKARADHARIGKRIAVLTYERSAEVYDLASLQRIDQYTARERISSVALSADDALLGIGEHERQVEVRRLLDKRTMSFKTQRDVIVKLIGFSLDGSELFVAEGSFHRQAQAYQWETGKQTASVASLQTLGRPFVGIDPRGFGEELVEVLSPDGTLRCALTQGNVACYTRCDGSVPGRKP